MEREVRDEGGRWYLTRVLPYRSADDRIEGVVITFTDITSRRNAEEAAHASEQRLSVELEAMRRLHSLVSRLLVTPDLPTALNDVLDSAVEITGADMGIIQLINRAGDTLEVVAHRGFSRDSLQQFRKIAVDGNSVFGRALQSRNRVVVSDITADVVEYKRLQTDGEPKYQAVQSTPLISRDGRPLGVLSTLYLQPHTPSDRDLRLLDLYTQQATNWVDQRWTEQELRRSHAAEQASEQRFHALFESIDQGFCIVEVLFDKNGSVWDYRFIDTNPAFEKNTGMANARGRTMRELVPNDNPLWLDVYGRIARNGTPERFEGYAESLARYFDVYAFRSGAPDARQVAILFNDITERTRQQEQQHLLLNELNHRVRNTLVTVQSIANQTLNGTDGAGDAAEKLRGRLTALSEAHDLLTQSSWAGAELGTLLRTVLAADDEGDRVSASGPVVLLAPQVALSLSLVLYELGTNARKHGALSTASGRLQISWAVASRQSESYLELDWSERDGPPVRVPERTGFGRGLIENSLRGVGGKTNLRFDSAGLSCRIELPLASTRKVPNAVG
jgi:PAS domain S-box-containing protein